tara:strand:+ start:637 stop:1032 length:396 start_codon:yes stop_codon:yes gene_type:complete
MSDTLNKLGQRIADMHDTYDSEVKYNHYNPKQRKQLYDHLTKPKKKREFAKEATKEQIDYLKNNYNRMVTTNGTNKKPLKLSADLVKDIKIDISPIITPRIQQPVQKPKQLEFNFKEEPQGLAAILGVDND